MESLNLLLCAFALTTPMTQLPVQRLAGPTMTLSRSQVTGGIEPVQAEVTLPEAPSRGSVTILLSSSHPAATVPDSITISLRASARFTVQTSAVPTDTPVVITAQIAPSGLKGSATLQVLAPQLSTLSITPAVISGGAKATGTVTLNGPAPAGGAQLTFSSSDPAVVFPQSLTVPAGSTSTTFEVGGSVVSVPTDATISARLGNSSKTAPIKVLLSVASVVFSPGPPGSKNAKLSLSGPAPAEGVQIALQLPYEPSPYGSGGIGVCFPPPSTVPSLTIPPGATSTDFSITTPPSLYREWVLLTRYGGAARHWTLLTYPGGSSAYPGGSLELPATIQGGSSVTGKIKMGSPTPSPACGYFLYNFTDDSAFLTIPAQVAVAGGATEAIFTISTTPVESPQTVTIKQLRQFVSVSNSAYSFTSGQVAVPAGTITVTP